MGRVKIVATIGPTTNSPEMLRALRDAGMSVARLNGAHSTLDWHHEAIDCIRKNLPETPIILDIPGQKIRTSKTGKPFPVAIGDSVTFMGEDTSAEGVVVIEYPPLAQVCAKGDPIRVDDGRLLFTVTEVMGSSVICRSESNGAITDAKGVHLPRTLSKEWGLTLKDRELLAFATKERVDFVAISFVETPDDIGSTRALIGSDGPGVIAKIETASALANVAGIAEVSDGLMVDRGDLSLDVQAEAIALYQKHIVKTANRLGRPVIGATEILHSMIKDSIPTKAEISDITNSVLDGCSALMLSGETAAGNYPLEAVATMRKVADIAVDGVPTDDSSPANDQALATASHVQSAIPDAMGEAIAVMCERLPITKIVAVTMGGYAARRIATQLPSQSILAVSNDAENARRFNLLPGTTGVFVDIPFSRTATDHIPQCLEHLWRSGQITDADLVLVTSVSYPKSGNRMNLVETHFVADLIESLGWKP